MPRRERALIRDQEAEAEKAREARDAAKSPRSPGRETLSPIAKRSVPAAYSAYLNDIESDPQHIGFAYGGVYPGRLHAKGQLVETHKVPNLQACRSWPL